jgi:hypothetical protein
LLAGHVQDSPWNKKAGHIRQTEITKHEAAEEYIHTFAKIVQEHDLTPEQINNTIKMGLLWCSLW